MNMQAITPEMRQRLAMLLSGQRQRGTNDPSAWGFDDPGRSAYQPGINWGERGGGSFNAPDVQSPEAGGEFMHSRFTNSDPGYGGREEGAGVKPFESPYTGPEIADQFRDMNAYNMTGDVAQADDDVVQDFIMAAQSGQIDKRIVRQLIEQYNQINRGTDRMDPEKAMRPGNMY